MSELEKLCSEIIIGLNIAYEKNLPIESVKTVELVIEENDIYAQLREQIKAQEARIMWYRCFRPDNKSTVKAKDAFAMAIQCQEYGLAVEEFPDRPTNAADEYLEAETEHYEGYFQDVMNGKAG